MISNQFITEALLNEGQKKEVLYSPESIRQHPKTSKKQAARVLRRLGRPSESGEQPHSHGYQSSFIISAQFL